MIKKIFILAVILLVVIPAAVFSVDLIGLRVGPTAMLNIPINPEQLPTDFFGNLDLDDFSFGIDARFNLTVLEVNTLTLIEPVIDESGFMGVLVTANVGAGVSIPVADIIKLGVFAGPALSFSVTEAGFVPGADFPVQPDDLFASNLYLRLTADVMIGELSVGGTYIIDTNTNINNIIDGTYDPASLLDNLEGKAGLSVLFSLF